MKKSEMLKKLYASVDEEILRNSGINIVDYILDKCEEFGMMPPDVGFNGTYEPMHAWEEE